MNKFHVGMPVIINRVDRPCARLVAFITKISKNIGIIEAEYFCYKQKCSARFEEVTPVEEFGVVLNITYSNVITCRKIKESSAKYADGRLRQWQPESKVEEMSDSLANLYDPDDLIFFYLADEYMNYCDSHKVIERDSIEFSAAVCDIRLRYKTYGGLEL